ncbi:hypothetical protein AB0J83_26410 [Actinoplanes sp. NPDC049596]|uniref:hypothetical protein n=1 Tax=unclassified Actinoplanes TaxID=2626549 RepID=UPI0034335DF0
MPVSEAPFSDLINKPKATLQPLTGSRAHAIRLRRRDDVDLVVTTADRYDQDHAVVSAALRLFRTIVLNGQADAVLDLLPEVFPWSRFLPPGDRHTLLIEFVDTLRAVEDLDTLAPVTQLLTEWRHTAEVYADPTVLAALTRGADDLGPVPEPPGA